MTVTMAPGPVGAAASAGAVSAGGASAGLSDVPHAVTSATEVINRQLESRRMRVLLGCVVLGPGMEAGLEDVGVEVPRVKGASGFRTREPDLGRAEEQRIDLVEVAFVALKDLVEGRAVVA